jgi:trans-2,3-dihydro-3-hydroxyanthranilate isomerase
MIDQSGGRGARGGPRFAIADVFAPAAFCGNQLAVFPDASGLDDAFLQRAANEIGYSETTFFVPAENADDDFRLRIFTPSRELPFAGHPIVGSAVVAALEGLPTATPGLVRFGTGVGTIEVAVETDSARSGRGEMRQPVPRLVYESTATEAVAEVARALGTEVDRVAVARSPLAALDNGVTVAIVPLDSLDAIRTLRPNPMLISDFCRRVGAVTLLAFTTETVEPGSTAHCRVFAPEAGIYEDAATGSANGPFGVYLARHGLAPWGAVVSEQGFEMGRPSLLRVTVTASEDGEASDVRVAGGVFVTGQGVIYG